jgi:S1 RNA binding domain protein
MELTVGTILEGKVKSITKFGAFISLPENKTGMVHISEVSNTFVNDIREHLTEGQSVRVKVISVDPAGRINLSIKRAAEPTPRAASNAPFDRRRSSEPERRSAVPHAPATFEEKLKQFMSDADSNLSSNRIYSDHRTKTRRR